MFRQREQAANLSTHTPEPSRRFNSIYYDDDDNEERGYEDLRTILEKESDEVVKSSVEDFVPIPIESEDTFDNDSECDLSFCDNSVTFSNPLLDANDDFTSSNSVTFSNPLFDANDDFTSSNDESLPENDRTSIASLLINDTIPYLPPEVFLDHDPKSLNDEPNIDDLKIKENVRFTFKDRHYLSLKFVIKIFLPLLTYLVNSLLLLSSGSEDTIFDPDISAYSFYSLEPVTYNSPMMIFPFFCFCPKDKGIRDPFVEIPSGEIKVRIEVLSVLWGNRLPIPNSLLPLSRSLVLDLYSLFSHLLWSSQSFGHQKGACPWSTENHFNSQYMKHWASQSFGT
ncbi:hypothetical protein Tco_0309563 [Tanacetum coccineum]